MLYLFVFLKLPLLALCWLVWWAIRQTPDLEEEDSGGEGGPRARPHAPPKLPRPPRRGPHGDQPPAAPPRVRSVTARARDAQR